MRALSRASSRPNVTNPPVIDAPHVCCRACSRSFRRKVHGTICLMLPPDPLVRRVAGLLLLIGAVGLLVLLSWVTGDGPVPVPGAVLIGAAAAGLGAGGLRLLLWPLGRRRS